MFAIGTPSSLRQDESFVAVGDDLFAFFDVGRESWKGHEHPWFSGDVGSKIPRCTGGVEGAIGNCINMLNPFILSIDSGLDTSVAVVSHIFDAVGDPLDVLFDGHYHVSQHRGAARAGDGEKVWKAGDGQAQVVARPGRPLFAQCQTLAALDVNLEQRPPSWHQTRWRR